MNDNSPAIELNHLSAGYRERLVLHDITSRIAPGEMVAILGPNGAGKTTLLRCITGLCRARAGEVRIFGRQVGTMSSADRAKLVAVVPQELETPAAFTVEEIVMMGRTSRIPRWQAPGKRDHVAVERSMAYTDISSLRRRQFNELSGGEKQRVVIAMALAQEPRIIVLDEATSHLDLNHRLEVMQIVERLHRESGATVLMISHDMNLAADFCPRLLMMDSGRIVADGPPASVLTRETLRNVFHADVRIVENQASGSVLVVPSPRLTPGCSGRGIRIHVVAGGGAAEEILRSLCLCDYVVTAGVLNDGDSDTETALALDVKVVTEKPFSPVSRKSFESAITLAEDADALIVSGVPFGPGNVLNLDLADAALRKGRKVFIMDGIADRDYTADRSATTKAAQLLRSGAVTWKNPADLLSLLPKNAS